MKEVESMLSTTQLQLLGNVRHGFGLFWVAYGSLLRVKLISNPRLFSAFIKQHDSILLLLLPFLSIYFTYSYPPPPPPPPLCVVFFRCLCKERRRQTERNSFVECDGPGSFDDTDRASVVSGLSSDPGAHDRPIVSALQMELAEAKDLIVQLEARLKSQGMSTLEVISAFTSTTDGSTTQYGDSTTPTAANTTTMLTSAATTSLTTPITVASVSTKNASDRVRCERAGEEDDDDIEAVRADLLLAQTDVARLQLENAKMSKTIKDYEKQSVRWRSKSNEEEVDTTALKNEVGTLRTNNTAMRGEVDAAKAESARLAEALKSLRREYDAHLADTGVADLVRAKSMLQEKNIDLEEELEIVRSRFQQINAELETVSMDRKRLQGHVTKLEQALQQKLPKSSKSTSVNAQLQQEIGILINENLEMREQVEQLEKRVRELELERTTQRSSLGESRSGSQNTSQAQLSTGSTLQTGAVVPARDVKPVLGMVKVRRAITTLFSLPIVLLHSHLSSLHLPL